MVTPRSAYEHTNRLLQDLFAKRQDDARNLAPACHQLWQVATDTALAGGKRLRPYLVALAYEAIANKPVDNTIYQAGLPVELLHIAVLMHDDIIDRDTVRHGKPNVSGRYQSLYASESAAVDIPHFANSSALIAGDLLLAEAYRSIASLNHPRSDSAFAAFHDGVFAVCGGELLDTEAPFRRNPTDALTICSLKTASYSFVMPLTIGAVLAGADEKQLSALRHFAEALGTAFQLTDDLLGVFGDNTKTGKSTIGDIREGKKTYLVEQFYQLASADQRAAFDAVFGRADLSDEAYARARQLMIDSGAQEACLLTIDRCSTDATAFLDHLDLTPDYRQAFYDLITRCTQRET